MFVVLLQINTTSQSSSSSRQSTMSLGSVDLLSYQDGLENVLTWLLEAEEVVEIQEPIANEVTAVKKQFGEHEVSYIRSVQNRVDCLDCALTVPIHQYP